MAKEIPSIQFRSGSTQFSGFEIIPLSRIIERRNELKEDPEKPHQLKFYSLTFYTKGESKQLVDFQWYPVQKNTLVYQSKEQINAYHFTKDIEGFCILFSQEYFEKCFGNLPKEVIFRLFSPHLYSPILQIPMSSDFDMYLSLLFKEFYAEHKFNTEAIIDSLFTIVLTKAEQLKQTQTFYQKDDQKLELFSKFNSLLYESYRTTRNADFYAQELGITYKHLNVICKELITKTAKQFIDDFIILEAKRKLINSQIKSNELAYEMGFDEPTNFTKYFKKLTGLTPNSFKKEHI